MELYIYTLLPLMVLLIVAVVSLACKARSRNGYSPVSPGSAGAVLILLGRFSIGGDIALYAGISLLNAAAWNAWPQNRAYVTAA